MILAKNNIFIIFIILAMCSCGKEQPDTSMSGMETLDTTYATPTRIELWIDSSRQEVKLFRVRKVNRASRMRLLVEMLIRYIFHCF